MTIQLLVEQLFNGVQFGLMLFLMAVGVTLVFGIMRVINLAHGSMFMLGGYVLAQAMERTQSLLIAVPITLLAVVVIGAVVELVVLRPLYARSHLDQVLATFGLTLMFNEAVTMIWGREPLYLSVPEFLEGSIEILPGVPYPVYRLAVTGVALVTGALLYVLINYTRIGALIRAGSDKREIVEALGVNIGLLYTLVFALGAALAGLAGMMTGPLLSIESGIGDPIPPHPDAGRHRHRGHGIDPRCLLRRAHRRHIRHVESCRPPAGHRWERERGIRRHGRLHPDGGRAAVQPDRPVQRGPRLTCRSRP